VEISISGSEDVNQTQIPKTTTRIESKKISGAEKDQKKMYIPSRTIGKTLKPEEENRTEVMKT
jgi:hypothetical protein